MNCMQELDQLLRDTTPPQALNDVVAHALARARRARTGHRVALCACAPLAVLVVFTALVNLLPGFALACQNVPVLKDLAQAVSFSPSLRAAVENGYVQMIGQEQTENGITLRVEYVIADAKQWYVFYKLQQSKNDQSLWVQPHVKDIDGNALQGAPISWGNSAGDNDDTMRRMAIYFTERDAPEALRLVCDVSAEDIVNEDAPPQQSTTDDLITAPPPPPTIATFTFELRVNPELLRKVNVYPQNKVLQLDGQKLTLKQVEVYPTHVLVSFEDDPTNSAWLKSIDLHLTDEKGNRYDHTKSGIFSSGGGGTPMTPSYYIESPYFSDCQHLTLSIDGATWLDKDRERARIDLKNGRAKGLPEGVTLSSATREGNNWILEFQELRGGIAGGVFDWNYWDEQGREYRFSTGQSTSTSEHDGLPAMAVERFALVDYPFEVVDLGLYMTRITTEEQPIVIPVK